MKKILLVSLGRNGGLPKYAKEMAAGLGANGMPFVALCARSSEHPIPGACCVRTYAGMATLLLSSLVVLPLLLLKIAAMLMKHRIRCIYFPYVHTWTPVIGAFGRLFGLRVVVTFHDYAPHLGEDGTLTRLVLRLSAAFASEFIFLSEHVRRDAEAVRPGIRGRSTVIPHGIFSLPGLEEKSPESLRRDVGRILFIGRISKYKGVELLLQAYAQSRLRGSAQLVIAGKSNYEIDRSLLVDGAGILDRYLDEAEMARLIGDADLIVLPYLEATQSGVVTLAIDSATPVIATDVGGIAEQLGAGEAILVPPEAEALCRAIDTAADPAVRAALCRALRARKASMGWPRLAGQVYAFCTEGGAGRVPA